MGIVLTEHTLDDTVARATRAWSPETKSKWGSHRRTAALPIHIYAEPQAQDQDEVPVIAPLPPQLVSMIKTRDWNLLVNELRAHEHEELMEGLDKGLLLHLALCFDAHS